MLLSLLLSSCLLLALADRPRYEEVDELKRRLLTDYNRDTIPATAEKGVQVKTSMSMIHMDLSDKGELDFSAYFTMYWTDSRLTWDTKAYPEVKQLQIKADALWIPDLEMFNALNFGPGSLSDTLRHPQHNAVVFPSGDVIYVPPVNGKVPCNQLASNDWLWGEYDCKIAIGSWTFDGSQLNTTMFEDKYYIDFEKSVADTTPVYFTENSFKDSPWVNATYDCCPNEFYPKLDFKFKVERAYTQSAPNGKQINPNPDPAFDPNA